MPRAIFLLKVKLPAPTKVALRSVAVNALPVPGFITNVDPDKLPIVELLAKVMVVVRVLVPELLSNAPKPSTPLPLSTNGVANVSPPEMLSVPPVLTVMVWLPRLLLLLTAKVPALMVVMSV